MSSPPEFNIHTQVNHSPHVVILGAGASKAAFPKGDVNGRSIPLMCELTKILDLGRLFRKAKIRTSFSDFEAIYDMLVSSGDCPDLVQTIEQRVADYFSGLELSDSATIYDYLVLSLREKDIIASFNWDPFLALAWQRNSNVVKLPRIVFLHGNVEVAVCPTHRVKNFRGHTCSKCSKPLHPAKLLFPIAHKNYNADPFIFSEWTEFKVFLKHAYLLTIFGYAAPKTDVEAKELMLNTWKENPTFELAQIEIIDIKNKKELHKTWQEFFCREHYGIFRTIQDSYLLSHPRRSCEAFAMATLQNDPWRENPFPNTTRLQEVQNIARILWREERSGFLSGKTTDELIQ